MPSNSLGQFRAIALARSDTQLDYYGQRHPGRDRLPDLVQPHCWPAFEASGRIDAVARDEDAAVMPIISFSTDLARFRGALRRAERGPPPSP